MHAGLTGRVVVGTGGGGGGGGGEHAATARAPATATPASRRIGAFGQVREALWAVDVWDGVEWTARSAGVAVTAPP